MRRVVAEGIRYRGKDIGEHEDSCCEEAGVEGFAKCENEYFAQAMVKVDNYRKILIVIFQLTHRKFTRKMCMKEGNYIEQLFSLFQE